IFLFFPYNTVYVMSTFFYSSRRRHTSSKRDWSSDVCSSDLSNASRTMLFNIRTLDWDDEILRVLDIPRCMLPQPMPSSCFYEYADPMHFGSGIKIAGAAGDQQAALFGQTCWTPGSAKNTFGTGGFMLMNTGETPVFSKNGLVTTI